MPLANYTSTVSPTKSLGEITKALVGAGARGIAQEYGGRDGSVTAVEFAIPMAGRHEQAHLLHFRLPLRPAEVRRVLTEQRVKAQYLSPEHVERVTWRVLRDWVLAQVAMIESGMLTLPEVMFPYMRAEDGDTVYQHWISSQPALTSG